MYVEDKTQDTPWWVVSLVTLIVLLFVFLYVVDYINAFSGTCPPGTKQSVAKGVFGLQGVCAPAQEGVSE